MPLVSKPCAFACRAERLARAGSGPHSFGVGNSSQSESVGPSADAGEEVTLGIASQVIRGYILNRSLVDVACSNIAMLDQLTKPSCGLGVVLVVVGRQATKSG